MARPSLQLPVIQNWSCHNCSGCCREHLIEITEEEKQRIDSQKWTSANGDLAGQSVVRPLGKGRYRLAHAADGACIFLNEDGLCRIHARFGEPAKPLACRVYPYAYHPSGPRSIAVSLRFSCPSVVQNLGQPVSDQVADLTGVASEIVRGKQRDHEAPLIHRDSHHGAQQTSWDDFHQFVEALDQSLQDSSVDFVVRLMRTLSWLELIEQSQFSTIKGSRLKELLTLVTNASVKAQPDNDLPLHSPKRIAKVMFRLMAAQYARHDTEADFQRGLGVRAELLTAALKYSTGWGTIPQLAGSSSVAKAFGTSDQKETPVRFSDAEGEFQARSGEIDELFERYFRVKIQGIHFCGAAFYDLSLVEGFRHLALMYPLVLWLARIRACSAKRHQLNLTDVQAALATADHNFSYSPALGMASALKRVSLLQRMNQITTLVGWYSR